MFALAMVGPACGDGVDDGRDGDGLRQPAEAEPRDLNEAFDLAAQEHDVPVSLLKSIAYAETGWQMVVAEAEFEGKPLTYGLMALREDRLDEAAELAGVSREDAATEPNANIMAAAAWLSNRADELGLEDRDDLGAWADVAAEWSGIDDEVARST
jgi:hypothetical protein